jgi:hypothetical protein
LIFQNSLSQGVPLYSILPSSQLLTEGGIAAGFSVHIPITRYADKVLFNPHLGISRAKMPGRIWRRSEIPLG